MFNYDYSVLTTLKYFSLITILYTYITIFKDIKHYYMLLYLYYMNCSIIFA